MTAPTSPRHLAANGVAASPQTVTLISVRDSHAFVRDTAGSRTMPSATIPRSDGRRSSAPIAEGHSAPDGERPCTRCGRTLPVAGFPPAARKADGRSSWCRDCQNAATRRWRAANAEVINAPRRVHHEPRACAGCGYRFAPRRVDAAFCCRGCRDAFRPGTPSESWIRAHRELHAAGVSARNDPPARGAR